MVLFISYTHSYAGWLIYHKPEFKGKVIDAETKEPIEGAVVVVLYYKHSLISGPGGGYSSVIKVKEILTDKNGEFIFPSYTTIIQPNSIEDEARFLIYKPGYGSYPDLQTSPPGVVSSEDFFSGESGRPGTVRINNETFKYLTGLVELPKLKTWDERRKSNMLSPTDDQNEWPLLHRMIKNEDEWLWNNKNWRR